MAALDIWNSDGRTVMSRSSQVVAAVVAVAFGGVQYVGAGQAGKLVAPMHGEAKVEITKPSSKVVGKDVVTTILVKNVEKAPIAGFKVEEYWYDRAGNPLGGGTYRHPRPLQPGEIITVTLKTPRSSKFDRNQCGFVHAYGPVKKTVVPKLVAPKPGT
jgi:hypothetical protein